MTRDYKKEIEEREIIKRETRPTIFIAIALMVSTMIYGALAYFVKIDLGIPKEARETIYWILIFIIILILIAILSVRKTIYFSPRHIREDFTLKQGLEKWRTFDIILLALAESIPILGLLLTWMGIEWNRTWFIFLVSILLMIILTPMPIKVRSKLTYVRQFSIQI